MLRCELSNGLSVVMKEQLYPVVTSEKIRILGGQKNEILRRSANESRNSQTCQAAFYKKFPMK